MERLYTYAFDLPDRIVAPLSWLPATLARIAVGWTFVLTGWGKLHALDQITAYFTSLGIPYPELQAPFVAATELVGGTLILIGLFTRFAAVPLAITMVVAIATAIWPEIDSAAALYGRVEFLYITLFAWLAIAGPGPLSADRILEGLLESRLAEDPFDGLAPRRRSVVVGG